MAVIKKTDNNTVGEDIQMLETLYVAGRNVKQCSQCGKQSTSSLIGYIYLSYAPAYSSSVYILKRNYNKHPYKNLYMGGEKKTTCTWMFTLALFIVTERKTTQTSKNWCVSFISSNEIKPYTGILFCNKNQWRTNMPQYGITGLEHIMFSKRIHS